jgi:hypothetical protein
LPRALHLPAQAGLRFQVAPSALPFSWAGVRILGLPLGFGPSAVPAMDARVTSNFSCLRRCRFQPGPESPRRLLSSCSAPDVGLGFPLILHLRLYRRWSSSRPDDRIFGGAEPPVSRVASSASHLVSPTIRRPGLPVRRILQYRLMDIRVTSDHSPSGLPWLNLRVAPDLLLRLRQSTNFQVALNLGSLTVRRFAAFRVAPNLGSSADPYLLPRVSPFRHLRLSR